MTYLCSIEKSSEQ